MGDEDNKRGFTGLSDLTSDVESISSKQHVISCFLLFPFFR